MDQYDDANPEIVGLGASNCVVALYPNDPVLYRICIRSTSLQRNNQFLLEDYHFINETIRPLLDEFLLEMELTALEPTLFQKCLEPYVKNWDTDTLWTMKIPSLIPTNSTKIIIDHYSSVHIAVDGIVSWELKPKWLYQSSEYCRNCTLCRIRGNSCKHCYAKLLEPGNQKKMVESIFEGIPVMRSFIEAAAEYFVRPDNILQVLYKVQRDIDSALQPIESASDVTPQHCLSMTLKDVSCFLFWHPGREIIPKVIDVDKKQPYRWTNWAAIESRIEEFSEKVIH
ncbi:HBR339Cp [Eremothecium sinecaudum]|uniref:Inositol-pentakisphosphate 2-kinase n=1 Tax=Eremothecium sinecaudum TaxID=45286 RepID=A0A125RE28_9SACH|nr:HBR339Cp [Eremothecium sinecaudum]AMD19240.1 HBR339Cp [Eremothecium sinecaudum]